MSVEIPEPPKEEQTATLRRLDQHPVMVFGTLAAVLVLLLIGISVYVSGRNVLTPSDFEALSGLAKRHYSEGHYEQARAIYQQMLQRSPSGYNSILFALGNTYFQEHEYEKAAEQYRALLDDPAYCHSAGMNLGLALVQLKRPAEALVLYDRIATNAVGKNPGIVARAKLAAGLLRERGAAVEPAAAAPEEKK